jgi:transposase
MKRYYYVGMDIHKKAVWYCVKRANGDIVQEGKIPATREDLSIWVQTLPRPWVGGMEATMFTGWIYDHLKNHAADLQVGHPLRMKAIATAKKKNDRLDAQTLADLLRSNLFPRCYMAPEQIRELRRVLRYRNLLVRESTRLKNKSAGLLMEVGAQYSKKRLNGKRYFQALLDTLEEVPASVRQMLRLNRESLEVFEHNQKWLVHELQEHSLLHDRVERLKSIPGVGEVTALTWALEVGDPHRFPSIKDAVSYCGLCGGHTESAGKIQREPLSKQRNKHLQTMLIEAAQLAPRWNPVLTALYEHERARGAKSNEATLSLARKLVAYLLYVDKTEKTFEVRQAA